MIRSREPGETGPNLTFANQKLWDSRLWDTTDSISDWSASWISTCSNFLSYRPILETSSSWWPACDPLSIYVCQIWNTLLAFEKTGIITFSAIIKTWSELFSTTRGSWKLGSSFLDPPGRDGSNGVCADVWLLLVIEKNWKNTFLYPKKTLSWSEHLNRSVLSSRIFWHT